MNCGKKGKKEMIIINELKKFFRDKTALILMILFPILLIYLLGNLLSEDNMADDVIGNLRIGYIIETNSPMEEAVVSNFIKESADEKNITFTKATEKEAAKGQVAGNELDGFVIFSDDKIQVYEGKDIIKNRTISAIMTGYSYLSKSITVIANTVPDKLTTEKTDRGSFVQEKEFNANRSMLDYYGVSMIVMMIFMGAIAGVDTFKEEKQLKTVNRLIVSPMRRNNIFLQKVIGKVPSAILEVVVIMIVSVVCFNVKYATTLSNNLILATFFLLTSFTMLMIGIVLGMFIKSNPMVYILGPVWVMMFLSGTFAKDIYIKGLSDCMPPYQVQQAAFDITVFGRTEKVFSIMTIEVIIIIAMTGIGVIRFNKMKEAR